MFLLAWVDHLKDLFSQKEVQFKMFCRPVKTCCQAIYVNLLCRCLNQCIKEHKGLVIGRHLKEQHRKEPEDVTKNFRIQVPKQALNDLLFVLKFFSLGS